MTRQNADESEGGSGADAERVLDAELDADAELDGDGELDPGEAPDPDLDADADADVDADPDADAEDPEPDRLASLKRHLGRTLVVLAPAIGLVVLLARWIRPLIPDWLTKAFLLRAAGVAVCTVSVALSTFVAEVVVFGRFEHRHDQQVEYAAFRAELAAGTAPIGSRDYQGVLLRPGAPVALLAIPSIGVDEVVDVGTSGAVLESGPGLERDSVLPGQVGTSVIMARASGYGGPFRYLDQLQSGDRIEVTTGQGVAEYRVAGVRHHGDPEPARLHGQLGRLTLVTASGAPYAPDDALRVDADLISDVQPTPPGTSPRPSHDEAAMAVNRFARLDVAGWTAVLAAATVLAFWAGPRWGRAKTWLVAVPVLLVVGLMLADRIALLLPNLT